MAGIEAAVVLAQGLSQLSTLVEDTTTNITDKWYQASQDMEAFKDMQTKLQRQSETWKEELRSAGMSDERRVTQPLFEAISCLENEKKKVDRLQSNCCFFMFMFRAQPFPPVLKKSMKKVMDAFENIITSLGEESSEAARALEKYAENHPLHQIIVDRRTVELSGTQQLVMEHLNDKTRNQVVTLWGSAGSGKTTLAKTVAQCYDQAENKTIFQDGAHILSCGHNATLESICKELFQSLNIPDVNKDSAEHKSKAGTTANCAQGLPLIVQSFVNRLRRHLKERHLLIVLDDVSDPELLKDKLIMPHEFARDVKYLITSQSKGIYEDAKMVHMDPPSLEEAMKILGNYIPDSPDGETFSMDKISEDLQNKAIEIIRKADSHPMTLATIGLQIDDFNDETSWDEVLNNFNDLLLSSGHTSGDRMIISMRMAIDALNDKEDAQKLLYLMAMCEPLYIPEVVLQILFLHIDPKQNDLKQVSTGKKFLKDRALITIDANYWALSSIYQHFILKNKKEEVNQLLYTLMENNDNNNYMKENDINDDHKLVRALCVLYIIFQDVIFTPIAIEAMENAAKEFNIPLKDKKMILDMRKALEPLINLLCLSKEGSKDYEGRRLRLISKAIKQFIFKRNLDDESFQQLLNEEDIYEDICEVLKKMIPVQRDDLSILTNDNILILDELVFNLTLFPKQIGITVETLSALSHAANCDFIIENDGVLKNLLKLLCGSDEDKKALALICLSALAKTPTAREKIASYKGLIEEVVAIFYMKDYDITQNSKMMVKIHAVNALASMAFQEKTSTKLVKTPDFLSSISQFLKDIYFKNQKHIFDTIDTDTNDLGAQSTIECLIALLKGNDKNKNDISMHEDLMDVLTKLFDRYNGDTTSSNDNPFTVSDDVAEVVIQLLTLINPEKYKDITLHYSIGAYLARGYAFEFQGLYKQAFIDYKMADRMDNTQEMSYKLKLCYIKAMLKDYKNAAYYAKLAIDANPNNQLVWQESGVLKELMEDYVGAKNDLNKSLGISPNDYETLKHRAYVNFKLECIEEAHEDAKRALQVIPKYRINDPEYKYGNLGVLCVPQFLGYSLK